MPARSSDWKSVGKAALLGLAITGIVIFSLWSEGFFSGSGGTDTTVPVPAVAARQATVAELRHAAQAQGVCYGWALVDGLGVTSNVSEGSNAGDGVPVYNQPSCPRWVQVRATIYYTDALSESPDRAAVEIVSSADLAAQLPTTAGLGRFGLDADVFVDDPDDAILRSVMVLPLLVHEAGLAVAVPRRAAAATATPSAPLDKAGNDLWRSRWLPLLTAMVLIGLAGAGFVIGWLRRAGRRDKSKPAPIPDVVPPGAGRAVEPSAAKGRARRSRPGARGS